MPQDLDMINARWIIASVFKDLYLSGLRDIRLQQTEFSIFLGSIVIFYSVQFENL